MRRPPGARNAWATAPSATRAAVSRALARSRTGRASSKPYFCMPARSAWPGRGRVSGALRASPASTAGVDRVGDMTCSHFGHSVLPIRMATGPPRVSAVPDAAEELDLVLLEGHPGAAAVAEPAAGQRRRATSSVVTSTPAGSPSRIATQGRAVRLPRGQPAQHAVILPRGAPDAPVGPPGVRAGHLWRACEVSAAMVQLPRTEDAEPLVTELEAVTLATDDDHLEVRGERTRPPARPGVGVPSRRTVHLRGPVGRTDDDP